VTSNPTNAYEANPQEDDDDEAELICCFRWRSFSMRRAAIFAALGINENAIGLA
jgi:hypothetical protein